MTATPAPLRELPALPAATALITLPPRPGMPKDRPMRGVYTAEQMRAYAEAALSARDAAGAVASLGHVSGYLSKAVEIVFDKGTPEWLRTPGLRVFLTGSPLLDAIGREGEGHNADWCAGWNACLVAHARGDIATPPASGEAGAVDGPDAAWKQASSEVFSTPLSQVREKYGTGDLYKAIASRADELRATPPAASSGDGIESVRRAIEDYIAEMRCLAHTDWADLTNFVNAQFRRLAAVAPAGMVLVPMEILNRFPEINPSNYDHDDVCALNAWGVELVLATPPATAGKE